MGSRIVSIDHGVGVVAKGAEMELIAFVPAQRQSELARLAVAFHRLLLITPMIVLRALYVLDEHEIPSLSGATLKIATISCGFSCFLTHKILLHFKRPKA